MINHTLEYLRIYLSQFITIPSSGGNTGSAGVVLDNIATANDTEGLQDDVLIISLVNLEEEFTRKNAPPQRTEDAGGRVSYQNPPVFLNLYVLFAAKVANYGSALTVLSDVISCFQSKHTFTLSNSGLDLSEADVSFSSEEERLFKIDLELYSMTFEQLNHLWGTLGGKQYPAAMYKVRLVSLEKQVTQRRGQTILEIALNSSAP